MKQPLEHAMLKSLSHRACCGLYHREPQTEKSMRGTLMMGLAMTLTACAIDDGDGADGDLATGSIEQDISGWAIGAWGTTNDLVGFDTGWSTSNSTCVLTQVTGNLTEGGYWEVKDVESEAGVRYGDNGHYWIRGHGGAYTNQVNQRDWAGNPVMAGAVCVPYTGTGGGMWKSQDPQYGLRPPLRIADLATNRRCFLTSIISGGAEFGASSDYVRVVKVTSGHTDSLHPTTGWYLESSLQSNAYTGAPVFAYADCIDFPAILAEWGAAFGGATYTITPGGDSAPKMCGLTGIYGAFNVNSWTNGATINAPGAQGGLWSMTVSAGKYAEANCIE